MSRKNKRLKFKYISWYSKKKNAKSGETFDVNAEIREVSYANAESAELSEVSVL